MGRLFVISASLFILLEVFFTGYAEAHELPSSIDNGVDACKGKERCVVVYMAPWCSACRRVVPLATELRSKIAEADRVGMQIIIGKDDKESLKDYAMSIGGEVYYDYQKTFADKYQVSSVPAWYVFSGKGQLLEQFSGAPSGASRRQIIDHLINDKLNIAEFMKPQVNWKQSQTVS